MALYFNNTKIDEADNDISFNGADVKYVNFNGTKVWHKKIKITFDSAIVGNYTDAPITVHNLDTGEYITTDVNGTVEVPYKSNIEITYGLGLTWISQFNINQPHKLTYNGIVATPKVQTYNNSGHGYIYSWVNNTDFTTGNNVTMKVEIPSSDTIDDMLISNNDDIIGDTVRLIPLRIVKSRTTVQISSNFYYQGEYLRDSRNFTATSGNNTYYKILWLHPGNGGTGEDTEISVDLMYTGIMEGRSYAAFVIDGVTVYNSWTGINAHLPAHSYIVAEPVDYECIQITNIAEGDHFQRITTFRNPNHVSIYMEYDKNKCTQEQIDNWNWEHNAYQSIPANSSVVITIEDTSGFSDEYIACEFTPSHAHGYRSYEYRTWVEEDDYGTPTNHTQISDRGIV